MTNEHEASGTAGAVVARLGRIAASPWAAGSRDRFDPLRGRSDQPAAHQLQHGCRDRLHGGSRLDAMRILEGEAAGVEIPPAGFPVRRCPCSRPQWQLACRRPLDFGYLGFNRCHRRFHDGAAPVRGCGVLGSIDCLRMFHGLPGIRVHGFQRHGFRRRGYDHARIRRRCDDRAASGRPLVFLRHGRGLRHSDPRKRACRRGRFLAPLFVSARWAIVCVGWA